MSKEKVIELALGEVGKPENPPGSNMTEYGERYGWNGVPWCVQFLWDCFNRAGERMSFFGGGKTASCSMLLRWYREQGLTVPVEAVQKGDIVLLNFHGGKDPEHCGLVLDKHLMWKHGATVEDIMRDDWTYQEIETIEGNTSPSDRSQSNGGMVCEKTRYPSQIVAVCRPQYKQEEETMKDDITGHWAEQSIRRVMGHGFLKGYPDGTFRPEQPVTRAELAVILDRLELEGRLDK